MARRDAKQDVMELPHDGYSTEEAQEPRAPRVGDWVIYWRCPNGHALIAAPAHIIHVHGETVHLNMHELGGISPVMNVKFSPTPQRGCWSWSE